MHSKQVTWSHGVHVWSICDTTKPTGQLELGPGARFVAVMAAAAASVASVMEHQLPCAFPQPVPATFAQMLTL